MLLEPQAAIASSFGSEDPGFVTVTETGSLTFNTPDDAALVTGGFANHGEVRSLAGALFMLGAVDEATPEQYSTGKLQGQPGPRCLWSLPSCTPAPGSTMSWGSTTSPCRQVTRSPWRTRELWYDPQSEERPLSGGGGARRDRRHSSPSPDRRFTHTVRSRRRGREDGRSDRPGLGAGPGRGRSLPRTGTSAWRTTRCWMSMACIGHSPAAS